MPRPPTPQTRTTAFLILNQATGAATGVLFWMLFARIIALDPSQIGVGYTVVALGTAVGLVAKGGLDTALMRHVPHAHRRDALRLLTLAAAIGTTVAVLGTLALAMAAAVASQGLPTRGWLLVGTIAAMLVVSWLQDAYFLAQGDPAATFRRNLVFSAGKLVLPLPVLFLAMRDPVPLAWSLSLVASAAAGVLLTRRQRPRGGTTVARRAFFRSATRNVAGNAAEFLPGLLLTPLVLAVSGAAAAGHFGMAWTAASLLFLASAAISRSALSEMVRRGGSVPAAAVRRAAAQAALLVIPGILAGMLLARQVMWIFGPGYADAAAPAFAVLCASALFVAPSYLYLAVLRAQERPLPLLLFPVALIAAIFALAPVLAAPFGLTGAALAWLLANMPFGLFAARRLHHISKGATHDPTTAVRGPSHTE